MSLKQSALGGLLVGTMLLTSACMLRAARTGLSGPAHGVRDHTATCGHYKHQGRWHYLPNHVHQTGCGHKFVGGLWVQPD